MTIEEQEKIKAKEYAKAMRFMANAKDDLKQAGRDGRFFEDPKYVSSASGIAYRGVLIALEAWLQLKGVEMPKENKRGEIKGKSIGFYREHLRRLDKRFLRELNGVYEALHLAGYYDCTISASTIDDGFEIADGIIERIKPAGVHYE
ncbi:MAG: DUF5618 family protein [Fibromonadaceae bacterium]|jgi:hypothetical protein|nr:DUF5618 family protein [Fibromonadaceae bacterium]